MRAITQKPSRVAGSLFLPYKGVFATCLQDTQRLAPLVQTHESQSRGPGPAGEAELGTDTAPHHAAFVLYRPQARGSVSIHPTVWVQSPSAHVLAPRGFLCILNKLAGHPYVGAVAPPFGGAAWEPCFSCGPQTGGARIIRSSSGRQLGPPEAGAAFQLWLQVIRRHIEFGKQCSKKGSL